MNGLNCGDYTFTCQLQAEAMLPEYKGSTLRGGFGAAFKNVVCALKRRECDDCPLRGNCLYAVVFETPLAGLWGSVELSGDDLSLMDRKIIPSAEKLNPVYSKTVIESGDHVQILPRTREYPAIFLRSLTGREKKSWKKFVRKTGATIAHRICSAICRWSNFNSGSHILMALRCPS